MRKKLICIIMVTILLIGIMPPQRVSASNADQLKISDKGVDFIKSFEGFSSTPHWDYSQYSIGYGSYCPSDMVEYYTNNPIDEKKATEMLMAELESSRGKSYYVRQFLKKYDLTVTQSQFDALVSLTYNIGQKWTTSTGYYIHKALVAEQWDLNYIIYSLGLYSTAGGEYLEGLVSRRRSEASMFVDGIYNRYPNSNMKYVLMDAAGGKVAYRMHTFDANRGSGIYTIMEKAPVGPDKNGNTVTYLFDGWYTAREGGTKVEVLDNSLSNGAVLYAHWKTPDGDSVVVPDGAANGGVDIKVTSSSVKLRTGPGTYFGSIGTAVKGQSLTVTMTDTYRDDLWGKTDKGWICLKYTDYTTALSTYFPHWGMVIADGVNVHMGAGADADVVCQKKTGDQVQILSWTLSAGKMWGKTEEGWICLENVELAPQEYNGKVVSLEMEKNPTKADYIQRHENLDLTGGTMKVSYEDGEVRSLPLQYAKVTGFDNTELGTTTVTVSYAGFTVTFDVNIIKATVTFVNYDGTVLSANQYAYGEEVLPPEDPTRPEDTVGFYKFKGWDKEVAPCDGNATYTAQYTLWGRVEFKNYDGTVIATQEYASGEMIAAPEDPTRPSDGTGIYNFIGWDREIGPCSGHAVYNAMYELIGDVTLDGKVTEADGIYLLWHIFFPEDYPLDTFADFDKNGVLDEKDGIYLLWHVFFAEDYPLSVE